MIENGAFLYDVVIETCKWETKYRWEEDSSHRSCGRRGVGEKSKEVAPQTQGLS